MTILSHRTIILAAEMAAEVTDSTTTMPPMTTKQAQLTTVSSSSSHFFPPLTTERSTANNCLLTLANGICISMRELIAWSLAAVFTILFVGLLAICIMVMCNYKKRQRKDNNVMCEMDGNPCYAVSLKKTEGPQEFHIYDRVKQN